MKHRRNVRRSAKDHKRNLRRNAKAGSQRAIRHLRGVVLQWRASGRSADQIAATLGTTAATVRALCTDNLDIAAVRQMLRAESDRRTRRQLDAYAATVALRQRNLTPRLVKKTARE
jgi:DNA-binding CsgD family transcriptional regulator